MTVQAQPPAPLFGRVEKLIAWMVGFAIVTGIILLLLWRFVFVTITPGHVGVLFSLLGGGTVHGSVISEGLAIKWPWNRIFLFEVRTRRLPFEVVALSAEGMNITIEGAALYRPVRIDTPDILTELGQDYPSRIVSPLTRAVIREQITQYNSNELYSVDHEVLQDRMLADMRAHELSRDIIIDDLVITEMRLPPQISQAIDQKLAQEQRAAGYQFLIAAEKLEAERLRIQAIGLQNFYAIVSESLNDTLLTWRGIEATVQLSQSNNSKIVIVGGGKDQLPLILGSDIASLPSQPVPIAPVDPARFQLPDFAKLPSLFPNGSANILNQGASRTGFPPPTGANQPPTGADRPSSRPGAGGVLEGSDSVQPEADAGPNTGTGLSSGAASDVDRPLR